MALDGKQLARLNELLDQSLPLSIDQRRAWLETLPAADEPLRPTLNDALLSDAPAARAAEQTYELVRSETLAGVVFDDESDSDARRRWHGGSVARAPR